MAKLDGSTEDNNKRILNGVCNLEPNLQKARNEKGNEIEWYGKRLYLLRTFYGKTQYDLTYYLNNVIRLKLSASRIVAWEVNEDKPNDAMIKHLADFFKVEPEFFTERIAHLNIVEQIKLTEI